MDARPIDDYFIGTNDAEVARLYRQHVVWRSRATDAWRRAGFTRGQHLVDYGCGPGYASLDLAAIAGPGGRVTAIDRSARFLESLETRLPTLGVRSIVPVVADLDEPSLPDFTADGAWCRWVFCFLRRPRALVSAIRERLRIGGTLVLHEYFDYGAWRLTPRSPALEKFVELVMRSWRADGGEPDIALDLLNWLPTDGFEIRELRPLIDVVGPTDPVWEWPDSFVEAGIQRLTGLGVMTGEQATTMLHDYREATGIAGVRLVTPAVLEIIATRVA
jgi:SAM-dependent methyltransferase